MRRILLAIAFICLATLAPVSVARADLNDFAVTNFTADYYINKSDPQGALDIAEQITVNFTDNNHGIERALPQEYNGQSQHIHLESVKRDGHAEPYSTYASNGNEVLRIGDPNHTVTGQHTYAINYSVQNVIRFTSSGDELDWNTNGTGWSQPFDSITARLHVPANVQTQNHGFSCYTGTLGSQVSDCTVNMAGDTTMFTTTRTLSPGQTMTFVTRFPVGTFQKPTAADWWHDHATNLLELVVPGIVALIIAYPYWRKNGKDIKGRGTIVPEYGPPDNLRAAEADVINHYKLGNNAISATIIDLAIRKYLKIVEAASKGVLGVGKHKTYTFVRLPAPSGGQLKPYEQQILEALFPSGDTSVTSDLKKSFYRTAKALQKDVPAALTVAGYFPKNPTRVGNWLHVVGFVVLITGFSIGGSNWYSHFGLVLAGLIVLLFASLMPRRTQKGVDAKDALAGLKLYMDVAEKDRLKMLQNADAPYAEHSPEPTRTVDLFEKLLPFAIILGVETSWANQFEGIYTSPPTWYAGNWQTFNTLYFVNSLNGSVAAMNSSFAAPASSAAGSGGGFAGGGGGGGGGGGW